MTFSIVGRSVDGQRHGVAVASKFLGAGGVVPGAAALVGAVATQADANCAYREQGLTLLSTGVSAAGTVAGLVAADPGRAVRQVGVVGRTGPGATYTGPDCNAWAGGVAGDGYAIQGNILTGPEVVEAMAGAWLAGTAQPFAERLVAALRAGDGAGGDRRGRQSAGLLVVAKNGGYGGTTDVVVDLRVDDHPDPVAELARLLDLHAFYFTRPDPASLLPLEGRLADEVQGLLGRLGYKIPPQDLETALGTWAGIENLEERLTPGRIDPLVLTHLRKLAHAAGGRGN